MSNNFNYQHRISKSGILRKHALNVKSIIDINNFVHKVVLEKNYFVNSLWFYTKSANDHLFRLLGSNQFVYRYTFKPLFSKTIF